MIRKLEENTVKKIAAGQTITCPEDALKELIENALDAQPTSVGISYTSAFSFKVSDNGRGIKFKDLPLAVERFATSKIATFEDLKRLRTYGFRGEALHAISMFSRLTIKSKHFSEKLGGKLVSVGGSVKELVPISFQTGTTVIVQELFFNAPVRRKSVRRQRFFEVAKDYILAHPQIRFHINDKVFPPSTLGERILRVCGPSFQKLSAKSFELFYTKDAGRVRKIFLNKRPVKIEALRKLLDELGVRQFLLYLELSPDKFDINLSPKKDVAVLKNPEPIISELKQALKPKFYVFKPEETVRVSEPPRKRPMRLIGSDETVLIAEDGVFYYFFDIHLLSERVNYERFLKSIRKGAFGYSSPLKSLVVSQEEAVRLRFFGVELERLGDGWLVKRIPMPLSVKDIEDIKSGKSPAAVAESACKKAVKSGMLLSPKDLKELFELYLECEEKEFCPHGRPIFYKVEKEQIFKKLGRR